MTPRLWVSSHMDHSLKNWTLWCLWVPSNLEHSVILVLLLQIISAKSRGSLQCIAAVLPVNTPIPQQMHVCLAEIRQNPLLPRVLFHGHHMEHKGHYEEHVPHSTITANPSRNTYLSFVPLKTISLPSSCKGQWASFPFPLEQEDIATWQLPAVRNSCSLGNMGKET